MSNKFHAINSYPVDISKSISHSLGSLVNLQSSLDGLILSLGEDKKNNIANGDINFLLEMNFRKMTNTDFC